MLQLYKTLAFWSTLDGSSYPAVKLEKVEKRFTRMSPGLQGLSYK